MVLHKRVLAVLTVATNADTIVENAYTGMFSVDPGIVVSFYGSAHHPHTTLAINELMIF